MATGWAFVPIVGEDAAERLRYEYRAMRSARNKASYHGCKLEKRLTVAEGGGWVLALKVVR